MIPKNADMSKLFCLNIDALAIPLPFLDFLWAVLEKNEIKGFGVWGDPPPIKRVPGSGTLLMGGDLPGELHGELPPH